MTGDGGDRPIGIDGLYPPVQLVQLGRRKDVVLSPRVTQLVHQGACLKNKGWDCKSSSSSVDSVGGNFQQ